ncbi:MAG: DUF448 domain-containing protein, partial [Acidimicrobiales bacterium]|nr:DUF448 domain-containing protein [Acidimicrobiales bacterium]
MAPQRTCIGCRRSAPPTELVRVSLGEAGSLEIDR